MEENYVPKPSQIIAVADEVLLPDIHTDDSNLSGDKSGVQSDESIGPNKAALEKLLSTRLLNPDYLYTDADISTCVDAFLRNEKFTYQVGSDYIVERLDDKTSNALDTEDYAVVLLTPPVDSTGQMPIDYFLDSHTQPNSILADLLSLLLDHLDELSALSKNALKERVFDMLAEQQCDEDVKAIVLTKLDDYSFDRERLSLYINKLNINHKKPDVFKDLTHAFQLYKKMMIRILFPYNRDNSHWLTGEIVIKKEYDNYHIKVYAHSPFGAGKMNDENFIQLCVKIKGKISGIHSISTLGKPDFITNNCESEFQLPRQSQGDGTSCGVIVVEDIIKRVSNQSLDRENPYPIGGEELRFLQIQTLIAVSGDGETERTQHFISRTTLSIEEKQLLEAKKQVNPEPSLSDKTADTIKSEPTIIKGESTTATLTENQAVSTKISETTQTSSVLPPLKKNLSTAQAPDASEAQNESLLAEQTKENTLIPFVKLDRDKLKDWTEKLSSGESIIVQGFSELGSVLGFNSSIFLPRKLLGVKELTLKKLNIKYSESNQPTHISFLIQLQELTLLESLPLSMKKIELTLNISIPFSLNSISGNIVGQLFVGNQAFPPIRISLPNDLDNFAIEMVESDYPIDGLDYLKPFFKGSNIALSLPEFSHLNKLSLSQLIIQVDRKFTGMQHCGFQLNPSKIPNTDPVSWEIIPKVLSIQDLTFNFNFPPSVFGIHGQINLTREANIPVRTSVLLKKDARPSKITLEVGAYEETSFHSYPISANTLSSLGFKGLDKLPNLLQNSLLLYKIRAEINTDVAPRIESYKINFGFESPWEVIPNYFAIEQAFMEIAVSTNADSTKDSLIEGSVIGDLKFEGIKPTLPVQLIIPKEGDWILALSLSDPEEGITLSALTGLQSLTNMPKLMNSIPKVLKELISDGIELTELGMRLSEPPQQEISNVFLTTKLANGLPITKSMEINDLKLHIEIDYTEKVPQIPFELSGILGIGGISLSVLLNYAGGVWSLALEPESENITLSQLQLTQLLSNNIALDKIIPGLTVPQITLSSLRMLFSSEKSEILETELEFVVESWELIKDSFSIENVLISMKVLKPAEQNPKIELSMTGIVQIDSYAVSLEISNDQDKWKIRLDPTSQEQEQPPISDWVAWLQDKVGIHQSIIPFDGVTISVMEMEFHEDMRIFHSLTFSGDLTQQWKPLPNGTLAIDMKKLKVKIKDPMNTQRQFSIDYEIQGKAKIGSGEVNVHYNKKAASWELKIDSTKSDHPTSLSELSKLLGDISFVDLLPGELKTFEVDLKKASILYNRNTNQLTSIDGRIQFSKRSRVKVLIPVAFEKYAGKSLEFSGELFFSDKDLEFSYNGPRNEWAFKTTIECSVTQLPGNLQRQFPRRFSADFEKISSGPLTLTINKDFKLDRLPRFNITGKEVTIKKIEILRPSIQWGDDTTLFANLDIYLKDPNKIIQLFGPNEMPTIFEFKRKKPLQFRLKVNHVDGLSVQLLSWPFSTPSIKEIGEWKHVDLGTLGEIRFKLPEFSYDGTDYSAAGEIGIVRGLQLPLNFIKQYFKRSGLGFLADLFPETPIPMESNDTLRQIIQNPPLNGDPEKLPDRFREYLSIVIPNHFGFEFSTLGSTLGLRFDLRSLEEENNEIKPFKFLIPAGPFLIGIKLKRVGLGELNGWITLDLDAEFDIFNTLLLVALSKWQLKKLPLLPHPKDVHFNLVCENLFAILFGSLPVPLFFDELSLSYLGVEGLEAKTTWAAPMPRITPSDVLKLVQMLPELAKFVIIPTHRLDPETIKFDNAELSLTIKEAYIKTPEYLASLVYGKHLSDGEPPVARVTSEDLVKFLNALKFPKPEDLFQLIQLANRSGPKGVSFGPLQTSSAWAVTFPKEFSGAQWETLLPNAVREELPSDVSSLQTLFNGQGEGMLFLMGGKWKVPNQEAPGLIDGSAMLGMSIAGIKKTGLYLSIQGAMGNDFISFNMSGVTVINLADFEQPLKLEASGTFTLNNTELFKFIARLNDDTFYLEGHVAVFDTFWIKAASLNNDQAVTGKVTGLIKKNGTFRVTGEVDAVGGNFPLLGVGSNNYATVTIANKSIQVKGAFSLIESTLLRLVGNATAELNAEHRIINLTGRLEGSSGLCGFSTGENGVTVLGENLGTDDSHVTISGNLSIIDKKLLSLKGAAVITYDSIKNISLAGHLQAGGLLFPSKPLLSVEGKKLSKPNRKVTITTDIQIINSGLISLIGAGSFTLDDKHLTLAGHVTAGGLLVPTRPLLAIDGKKLLRSGRKVTITSPLPIINTNLISLIGSGTFTLDDNNLDLAGHVTAGGLLVPTRPLLSIVGKKLLKSARIVTITSPLPIINTGLVSLNGTGTFTLDNKNLSLSGHVRAGGLLIPSNPLVSIVGQQLLSNGRKVTISSSLPIINTSLLSLIGGGTFTLNDNNLSLSGHVTAGGVLFPTRPSLSVVGNQLLNSGRTILLKHTFNIIDTPFLRLAGDATIWLRDNGISLVGNMTGAQRFFTFLTSGGARVKVTNNHLTSSSNSFNISGWCGIDTKFIRFGGNISKGTIDMHKQVSITANMESSIGSFALSGGTVSVSNNHLVLISNWLGVSVKLTSSINNNTIILSTANVLKFSPNINLSFDPGSKEISAEACLKFKFIGKKCISRTERISLPKININTTFNAAVALSISATSFSASIEGKFKYNNLERTLGKFTIHSPPADINALISNIVDEIKKKGASIFSNEVTSSINSGVDSLKNRIKDTLRDKFGLIITTIFHVLDKKSELREVSMVTDWWDNYVRDSGAEFLEDYYESAIKIIDVIHDDPDYKGILENLYDKYLVKCIEYIDQEKPDEALQIYSKMVSDLKEKYLSEKQELFANRVHKPSLFFSPTRDQTAEFANEYTKENSYERK